MDEAVLELGRDVAVERLGDVVLDVVEQPARADHGDVGGGAAGDIGGQALLEVIPGDDLDLDLVAGMVGHVVLGHALEQALRRGAVIAQHDLAAFRHWR